MLKGLYLHKYISKFFVEAKVIVIHQCLTRFYFKAVNDAFENFAPYRGAKVDPYISTSL